MNIPLLASPLLFLFLQSRNLSLPVHTASPASTAAPRSSAPAAVWGRPVAARAAAAGPVALGTSLRSHTKLLNFLNKWRHYTVGFEVKTSKDSVLEVF